MEEQKTTRAVIVGCGGISHTWLNTAQNMPYLELVGLVDLDLAARRCEYQVLVIGQRDLEKAIATAA